MNSTELKKAKRRVRTDIRELRDAIPEDERIRSGEEIVERFLALPELRGARTVMAFWSFGSEVPTAGLIERLRGEGFRTALPRIVAGELEPRTFVPGDRVTMASFGAGEPSGGQVLGDSEVDVVVTPGVAFDRRGKRIGYGGGFYDRFFVRARPDALRTGICFGVQLVDRPLPAGNFDLSLDLIVTESETLRITRDQ